MRMKYFGDSYDVVKRSLVDWLLEFGDWDAHPMFTEEVSNAETKMYSDFLNVHVSSKAVLNPTTNRITYFKSTKESGNMFLDPNTGVKLYGGQLRPSPDYLYLFELQKIVHHRPSFLTLVFDQAVARGNEPKSVATKLARFQESGIHGMTYISHACFHILAADSNLLRSVYSRLLKKSKLPNSRFICSWAA